MAVIRNMHPNIISTVCATRFGSQHTHVLWERISVYLCSCLTFNDFSLVGDVYACKWHSIPIFFFLVSLFPSSQIVYHFSFWLSLSLTPLMDGQIMYIQSSSAPDAVRDCDKSLVGAGGGGGGRAERGEGKGWRRGHDIWRTRRRRIRRMQQREGLREVSA